MTILTEDEKRALHKAFFVSIDGKAWLAYETITDKQFNLMASSLIGSALLARMRVKKIVYGARDMFKGYRR
jgi:hypothetical protein